jgi:hypothetical protein
VGAAVAGAVAASLCVKVAPEVVSMLTATVVGVI